MEAHRIETVVAQDGTITIRGIPLRAGEKVEVVVFSRSCELKGKKRYPLRGKPIKYHAPFEGIADNEWDVLQ